MDLSETFTKPLKDFAKNSLRLVKRCTKPDAKGTLGTNASRWGGGAPVKCWWSGGVGGEREREASAGPSGHPHTRGRSHPLARKGSMIARAVCGGRARSRGSSSPPHPPEHHTACLPRSRTFRSLAPFSLTRFSAPLPPSRRFSTAQSTRRSACRLLSGSRSWVSLVSSSSLFSSRSTTSSWEETRRRLRRLRRLERILLRGGVKQYTTINHKVGAGRCEVGTPNKTKKQEAP